jgi:hypothetical protein
MPIQHPNAKSAYITHEGRLFSHPPRVVLVIETDLHTNPHHPDFDFEALAALISAAEAYVATQNRRAARNRQIVDFHIIPTGDRI